MTAVEASPSQVTQAPGFQDNPYLIASETDLNPESSLSHPLQLKILTEWRPLMLEGGEGSPARRIDAVRDRADRFDRMRSGMTTHELDGTEDDLIRYGNYVKINIVDASTSLGIDVGSFVDAKQQVIQIEYPSDRIYALLREGYSWGEAMAHYKYMYKNGFALEDLSEMPPVPLFEWQYRLPRRPSFKDPFQDITDTWQRRASGMFLRASETLPNFRGETQEFIDEFEGMTPEQINALAVKGRFIKADDESGDPNIVKLKAIGFEAADAIIGWDGYASAINDDQEDSNKDTLDAMKLRYKKTIKLVRAGIPEPQALYLQREVEKRRKLGGAMPFMPAAAAAILLV